MSHETLLIILLAAVLVTAAVTGVLAFRKAAASHRSDEDESDG